MKKLFSFALLAMMMVASKTFAQSSLLVTLSHEGEITAYYGARAFKSAMLSATHGDVITLSSGSFEAATIDKAVTIRGAGMEANKDLNSYPTILLNNFNIDIPDSISQPLTIEGIYHDGKIYVYQTLTNATFIKDRLYYVFIPAKFNSSDRSGCLKNVNFLHCKFMNGFGSQSSGNNASFVNCTFGGINFYYNTSSSSYVFTNCLIRWDGSKENGTYWCPYSFRYATCRNCIFYLESDNYSNSGHRIIDGTTSIYKCLGIAPSSAIKDLFYNFSGSANASYYTATTEDQIFKDFDGTNFNQSSFELTDEAKASYLGDDGTEVGIYGGNMPFSPITTTPRITKFNVASKSTADGKLSVDIEVKAAE